MIPILTARHAELVAAREQNSRHILELRGLLAQAEQADYGYSVALGEIERLLAQLDAAQPAPTDTPDA
jgi:hypothetical protein